MPNIFQSLYRVVNDNPGTEKLKEREQKRKRLRKKESEKKIKEKHRIDKINRET